MSKLASISSFLFLVAYVCARSNSPCRFELYDEDGLIVYDFYSLAGRGNGDKGVWHNPGHYGDFFFNFCMGAEQKTNCTSKTAICREDDGVYSDCGKLDDFTWSAHPYDARKGAIVKFSGGAAHSYCDTPSRTTETTVIFECDRTVPVGRMYEVYEDSSTDCQFHFRFLTAKACAELKPCPEIEVPQHAKVMCTGGVQPGSDCAFSCDENYWLDGNYLSQCGVDGTWTYEAPKCRRAAEEGLGSVGAGFLSFAIGLIVGAAAIFVYVTQFAKANHGSSDERSHLTAISSDDAGTF